MVWSDVLGKMDGYDVTLQNLQSINKGSYAGGNLCKALDGT